MILQIPSLAFNVRRHTPELVTPASPTPREIKLLSDIDDQNGLRCQIPLVHFFPYKPSMEGKDPVEVIRKALAKTLVFYYPFAGRLKEGHNGKLMVDCNEEGVMFIEADADVTIEQFGDNIVPPFPCFDELLYNVPGSDGITDCPLLLIQVTRLKCGGFIFAVRMNHTMCDGSGICQFLKALSEIAHGAPNPSILPVWHREFFCARDPPKVTCTHHEYKQLPPDTRSMFKSIHRSFFFGPKDIVTLRSLLPHHLATKSTSFEVLTAFLWRCHTIALQWQNPNQEILLLFVVNARFGNCRFNHPLPDGFYGNAFVFSVAVSTVGELLDRPLGFALELVKKAKGEANKEYVHFVADLMVIKGRPSCTMPGSSFVVSDITKSGFTDVNFGWDRALYCGVAKGGLDDIPGVSFYVPYTNSKGERGRVVPICLPEDAMERFEKELNDTLSIKNNTPMLKSSL